MGHLQTSRLIPAPAVEVFRHIADLENLPDWLGAHMAVSFPSIIPPLREQTEFEIGLTRLKVSTRVILRVEAFDPPERFTYRQVHGFFRSWSHSQVLKPHSEKATVLSDIVSFHLPFGILGALADDLIIRRDIEGILKDRLLKIEEHFLKR